MLSVASRAAGPHTPYLEEAGDDGGPAVLGVDVLDQRQAPPLRQGEPVMSQSNVVKAKHVPVVVGQAPQASGTTASPLTDTSTSLPLSLPPPYLPCPRW